MTSSHQNLAAGCQDEPIGEIRLVTTSLDKSSPGMFSLRWYFQILFSNWLLSGQLVLASFLTRLFALALPVFYLIIFDRVFGRQNLATLDVIGLGVLMVICFELIIKQLRSYLLAHQLKWLDQVTSELLTERLLILDKAGENKTSLAERFNNLVKVNRAMGQVMLASLPDAVFSILVAILLILLHPFLAIVSLIPLAPIALHSWWYAPRARANSLLGLKEQRESHVQILELLHGRETLQALHATSRKVERMQEQIQQYLRNNFSHTLDTLGQSNLPGFFINLGSIVTLYVGARAVLQGEISFGVYLAINMLSRIVLTSFQQLLTALLHCQETSVALRQLQDTISSSDNVRSKLRPSSSSRYIRLNQSQGCLKADNLRFRYSPDEPWILDGLTLDIQPGERIVITGKSGAGKSTLAKLLAGMYQPSSGHVMLDGYNLADIHPDDIGRQVGLVLQKPVLFTGSIRENLLLGNPAASARDLQEVSVIAQLDELLHRSSQGLDSPVLPMGANLSGGQIQRIALAQVLLRKTQTLILDETLQDLPPVMQTNIINAIHQNFQHSTCVFITNFIPLHQVASRILVIENGRLVEQGTFKALMQQKGPYYHLNNLSPARTATS